MSQGRPPLIPYLCGDCHTGWLAPRGARRCPECGGDNFSRPAATPGPQLLPPPGWQPPPAPTAFEHGFGGALGVITAVGVASALGVALAVFACCGGAGLLVR